MSDHTLLALVSGAVAEPERTLIDEHLDRCEACQILVAAAAASPSGVPAGPPPEATLLARGALIAERYVVERFVARGGMGEVYAALDQALGERVALKTVRATSADDPKAVARLKSEVQLARRVSHAHACRIYDFGTHASEEGPLHFLTMEFIDGDTLGRRLRREGPLGSEQVRAVAGQLLSGLSAVHQLGIVHRDLKSDNVMLHRVSPRGLELDAVIMDFGLARGLAEPRARVTSHSRGLIGSAAYMAPEQVLGEELAPSTDVYALGVVLFEMLTGTLPFGGDTPIATALERLHKPAPLPSTRRAGLPPCWDPLVARYLAREPRDRPRDGEAAGQLLRAALESASVQLGTRVRPATRMARRWALGVVPLVIAAWFIWQQWRGPARSATFEPAEPASRAEPVSTSPVTLVEASLPSPAAARGAPFEIASERPVPDTPPAPALTRPPPGQRRSLPAESPRSQAPAELQTPSAAAPEPPRRKPSDDPNDGFKW